MSTRAKLRAVPVESVATPGSRPPQQNDILSRIPVAELAAIMEHAAEIDCPGRDVMFEAGGMIEKVYFPLTGMASLVIILENGTTVEAMTQEFLSQMLAVRRPGVTVAMASLAKKRLISYRYRQVTLLHVPRLKETACECYATIRGRADELLA